MGISLVSVGFLQVEHIFMILYFFIFEYHLFCFLGNNEIRDLDWLLLKRV